VHAEFVVVHSALPSDALKSRLIGKFQAEDRNALKGSSLFNSGKWDDRVLYCTETPGYRLFCVPTQDEESQIYIEPVKGNVIKVCDSVWRGTKKALRASSPKLSSLELVDGESGKDIMGACESTLSQEFARRETLSPVMVGVVSLVYGVVGIRTFAAADGAKFLAGAVAGLAAAVVAAIAALIAARKGRLIWK
jgi:hypothetical protein